MFRPSVLTSLVGEAMTSHIHYELARVRAADMRRAAETARLAAECAAPTQSRRPDRRRDWGPRRLLGPEPGR
jgi:hypothetical protein